MASRWFDSPLTAFNAFVLKDPGGRLIARDRAYGDHPRQQLDLYAPRRLLDGARLPVIAFFYGGSWATGVRQGYGFVGRALAARGFLVAVADYRLVPEVRFPAFVEDAAAAVRWLFEHAEEHQGDPERLVVMGHSAGAYNAAMAALDPQWLRTERARVRGLIGLAGPYDFLPLSGAVTKAAFGKAEDLAATQPVNFAAGAPPTLLLHGGQDRTVLPRNSKSLAKAVAAAGGEARVKLYPQLGHVAILTALALPFRYRAPVLADVAGFANEVCGR